MSCRSVSHLVPAFGPQIVPDTGTCPGHLPRLKGRRKGAPIRSIQTFTCMFFVEQINIICHISVRQPYGYKLTWMLTSMSWKDCERRPRIWRSRGNWAKQSKSALNELGGTRDRFEGAKKEKAGLFKSPLNARPRPRRE